MTPAPAAMPFLGTWKLTSIVATSAIEVPMPQQSLVRFEQQADGIHYTADGTLPSGQTMHAEAVFQLDGQPYAMRGSLLGDAMSVMPLDSRRSEVTLLRAGVPAVKILAAVSADSQQMTGSWEIHTPGGTATYATISARQAE